jgi:hypothetical protein
MCESLCNTDFSLFDAELREAASATVGQAVSPAKPASGRIFPPVSGWTAPTQIPSPLSEEEL